MSIDMKQFHTVFFEESQEHLDEMEQLLLDLDLSAPDAEMLNSIFRAAHSIKGGSGIFGFDALTSATHIMEGLLDKIRKGNLAITAEMIDLFLAAVDQLKEILRAYRHGEAIDWAGVHQLTEKLEIITAGVTTDSPKAAASDHNTYGFFSDPPVAPEPEAYGFFDDPAPATDDGYGFFDELVGSEAVVNTNKDDVYGFVDSLLSPAVDDSFGFFEPLSPVLSDSENGASVSPIPVSAPPSISTPNTVSVSNTAAPVVELHSATKQKTPDTSVVESSSIRVDVAKVDQLINLVGEIVITQSMMNLLGQGLEGAIAEKFQAVASELERNTREIQEAVMSIRMLPVSFVFNRFPRVVRDLSGKLGKNIELIIEGGDTELDKGLTEKLVDPLTHLVRNSIDHGIESAEVRRERGKDPVGKVTLRAAQQGGNIVISISDDGGGLNRERILAKALENNIAISENPKDEEVWQLIFAPGFSTAAAVTDISGRGVGMDVVKRNVQSLGGRIHIESHAGQGSTFTIHLPLTLAIVDGMCVSVGDQTFIIPLVHIVESMQPAQQDIKTLAGDDELLHVRNEYWPILHLYKIMQLEPVYREVPRGIVVLVETAKHRFALFVDALVGQQQVVIKSLEQHYKRVDGVAGATILGDGSVALILDVESLALSVHQSATLAAAI
ncbi:chemotaxis protein CheA [Cellvibrio sp. PSBB023]|uniref:chemotaxis protein CheA n=1 Tax=Cellvibrio sp. PSBB023 TaxID=1945512 RepID=UPI00098ED1A5|nr:chemotaxis protein CheA [Cellvibrio sp. PSBB023]AQT60152.1 chemotaxis protein CheA [Cellvibrio sp. PSBB023]